MDGELYWSATIDCDEMPCYTVLCNRKIPVRFTADTEALARKKAEKYALECHNEKVIIA